MTSKRSFVLLTFIISGNKTMKLASSLFCIINRVVERGIGDCDFVFTLHLMTKNSRFCISDGLNKYLAVFENKMIYANLNRSVCSLFEPFIVYLSFVSSGPEIFFNKPTAKARNKNLQRDV